MREDAEPAWSTDLEESVRLSLSLPEIARIDTSTEESAIAHIVSALTPSDGGFNYLDATKRIKVAYNGLHRLDLLTQITQANAAKVGQVYNVQVVKLAAPNAFNRKTKVVEIGPRKFHYGEGRDASYRAPFFFLENGVVKLYYLQPRKNTIFSRGNYELYVSIVKKFLLDTEFFGEHTDVEIVDVSEKAKGQGRTLQTFSMSDFEVWSDAKIASHLNVVLKALEFVERENLISRQRRPLKDKDLPLFF